MAGFVKGMFAGLFLAAVAVIAIAVAPALQTETPLDQPEARPEPAAPEPLADTPAVGTDRSQAEAPEDPPQPDATLPVSGDDAAAAPEEPTAAEEAPAETTPPESPMEPVEAAEDPEVGAAEPEQGAAEDTVGRDVPADLDAAHVPPRGGPVDEAEAEPAAALPEDEGQPEARALAVERGREAAERPAEPDAPEDSAPQAPDAPLAEDDLHESADARDAEPPAVQRNASAFQAASDRALYAVILIDVAADPQAEAKLLALPAPVTVALDPEDPDAGRRARAYRSAGHEVAILAPESWPQSPGAIVAAAQAAVPDAVAWLARSSAHWPDTPEALAELAGELDHAGLALALSGAAPDALPEAGAPRVVVQHEVDPAADNRAMTLDLLDAVAETADGSDVVAVVGHVGHGPMLEALMQRAGREHSAPAGPAPLSAAVARASR